MQWLDKVKLLFDKKSPQKEYFLALILKEKTVKAVVWEEREGEVSVVDTGVVFAEHMLEKLDDETLLKLADQAIGLAEKTLPADVKTTKTIFGLPEWWVEGNAIDPAHLTKIKKIAKELELKPLGFVVIPEAIAHLLKIEEGVPPTVLLVSLGEHTIGVTLVQAGRIEASKTAAKEGKSDSEGAATIIRSFGNVEVLPSRMLLFDGQVSLEEAKQEFIAYPWTKELSFLHFPRIDILDEDADSKAVVSGAAKELGFSFEEEGAKEEIAEKPDLEEEVALEGAKSSKEEEKESAFGFVEEQDIAKAVVKPPVPSQVLEDDEDENAVASQGSEAKFPNPIKLSLFSMLRTIGKLTNVLKLPRVHFAFSFPVHGGFWLPLVVVFVLLAIFIGGFLFIPKATITLSPYVRTLENDVVIAADPESTSVNKEEKIIPATVVEVRQEGEKSQKATGKKLVGDKAKGEVTIYNKTENQKTFSKGTVLTGPNTLRFTLDEDVTVASTAAFELTPSSAKVKVTAAQIGEESNLASNTNFPFKDFPTSSYFAKNDAPFTGGTKREVVVVSKEDQEKLLTSLSEELRNQAKDELRGKSDGRQIVDVAMTETITTKEFSKDIDAEADEVGLKLAISFSVLAYKESDLLELVENEILQRIPEGFVFEEDTFETAVVSAGKEKAGTTSLTIHYKASLLPDLDMAGIRSNIAGKSKPAVQAYFQSLPLENFTIEQTVSFPPPLDLLPQRSENITIEVKTN